MKTGRNDPCSCGSGRKYKKCCLPKDEASERAARQQAWKPPPPPPDPWQPGKPRPAPSFAQPGMRAPSRPDPDPKEEARATWIEEFETSEHETQVDMLRQAIRDRLLDGEDAREAFDLVAFAAARREEREIIDELAAELRREMPRVFEEAAGTIVPWLLENALVARDPARLAEAGRDIVTCSHAEPMIIQEAMDRLAFHGQGRLLAAVGKEAWKDLDEDDELAEEHVLCARSVQFILLDRLERSRLFPGEHSCPPAEELAASGHDAKEDFSSIQEHLLDELRTSLCRENAPDSALDEQLMSLASAFLLYLRDVEDVPFSLGELAVTALVLYLGNLPDMEGKRPSVRFFPKPGSLTSFFTEVYDVRMGQDLHPAAALLEQMPAWLRFLERNELVSARERDRTLDALRPLVKKLSLLLSVEATDPALVKALADWPRPLPAGSGARALRPDGNMVTESGEIVEWDVAPREERRPASSVRIDWDRAVAGAPCRAFLEGRVLDDTFELGELFEEFLSCLEGGDFLRWEAVIREEQGLPLTRRHRRLLEEILNFGGEDDREDRVLYIDESPRYDRPWYETLRELAPRLLLDLPIRGEAVYDDVIHEGWDRLARALEEHGRDLSLPEGAAGPMDVLPPDLRHRLEMQACCLELNGIGQDFGDEPNSLADEGGQERLTVFLSRLEEHRESVAFLGLTLGNLREFIELPAKDQEILESAIAETLGLESREAPIAGAI